MKLNNHITIERLEESFKYNPETGEIIWIRSGGRKKIGKAAGGLLSRGYLNIGIDGVILKAHRIAFALYYKRWPTCLIDHINGNKADNRICNLREAEPKQNQANCKKRIDNTSGFKGVNFHKRIGKWAVQIQKNKKRHCVGYFENIEDAKTARIQAAKLEYGEFSNQ